VRALLLVLIVRLIEATCKQFRQVRAPKQRPLCTDCVHAHVQYAVNGRRAIACTFAGAVRPVMIDVMYCTDYRDRNAAPRLVSIGFVRERAGTNAATEAASERLPRPSRLLGGRGSSPRARPVYFNRNGPARLGSIPKIPTVPRKRREVRMGHPGQFPASFHQRLTRKSYQRKLKTDG